MIENNTGPLTDSERALIELVRSAEDPAQALITATEIISAFLAQL